MGVCLLRKTSRLYFRYFGDYSTDLVAIQLRVRRRRAAVFKRKLLFRRRRVRDRETLLNLCRKVYLPSHHLFLLLFFRRIMKDSLKESPDPLQNRQNASHPETESADATQTKSKNQRLAKQDGDKKRADDLSEAEKPSKKDKTDGKKKKKRNWWPLKAFVLSLTLSFAVNAGSELVLEDAQLWLAIVLTLVILAFGVGFDMIGTSATSCEVGPFLAMASRKVKGAKTAVKLAKNCDVVSSVCCDVVGDICGVVSGVCAATIAVTVTQANNNFWISVLIYALISTATISLKALGKGVAVNKANTILFGVAKVLSVFSKDG